MGHALEMIMKQVPLELPTTDASGAPLPVERCVRLLETYHSRIYKVLGQAEQIHSINDNYWTIRAEVCAKFVRAEPRRLCPPPAACGVRRA